MAVRALDMVDVLSGVFHSGVQSLFLLPHPKARCPNELDSSTESFDLDSEFSKSLGSKSTCLGREVGRNQMWDGFLKARMNPDRRRRHTRRNTEYEWEWLGVCLCCHMSRGQTAGILDTLRMRAQWSTQEDHQWKIHYKMLHFLEAEKKVFGGWSGGYFAVEYCPRRIRLI